MGRSIPEILLNRDNEGVDMDFLIRDLVLLLSESISGCGEREGFIGDGGVRIGDLLNTDGDLIVKRAGLEEKKKEGDLAVEVEDVGTSDVEVCVKLISVFVLNL